MGNTNGSDRTGVPGRRLDVLLLINVPKPHAAVLPAGNEPPVVREKGNGTRGGRVPLQLFRLFNLPQAYGSIRPDGQKAAAVRGIRQTGHRTLVASEPHFRKYLPDMP